MQYEKVKNNKLEYILQDKNTYPEELVDLAVKKEETIDFVYNYIKHKNNEYKNDINIDKDYKKGEFPLFIQWDERWGYRYYYGRSKRSMEILYLSFFITKV